MVRPPQNFPWLGLQARRELTMPNVRRLHTNNSPLHACMIPTWGRLKLFWERTPAPDVAFFLIPGAAAVWSCANSRAAWSELRAPTTPVVGVFQARTL